MLGNGYCDAFVLKPNASEITIEDVTYPPFSDIFQPMRHFAHEFSHAIEWELQRLDSRFSGKVKKAYAKSVELGTWSGHYSERSIWNEYWAEGVEMWFYSIGAGAEFESYKAFFERDPLLAGLLDKWFPRVSLRR